MDGSEADASLPRYPGADVGPRPPTQRRRSTALLVVALLAVIVCAPCTGAVVLVSAERGRPTVTFVDPFEPPAPDAEPFEWFVWSQRAVEGMVQPRGPALLAGDERAFLDVIDPAVPELRDQQRRLFMTLRQMGVTRWEESVDFAEADAGGRVVEATLVQSFCFGGPDCRPQTISIATEWRVGEGRLYLTSLTSGVRPWELSDVDVATGARTIVVVASRLGVPASRFLPATEQAARVADTFARWGGPPDRYVIAVASDEEFTTWYDNLDHSPAGKYLEEHGGDVLVRYSTFDHDGPMAEQDVMTHELTHAATVPGPQLGMQIDAPIDAAERSMLVEGIAEYATMVGRPIAEYPRLDLVRLALDRPAALSTDQRRLADYGIWFLTLRWLADTYDEEAMLTFFGRALHEGRDLNNSAYVAFGQNWTTLQTSIDAFLYAV